MSQHLTKFSLPERVREADGADVGDGCVHVVLHVRDAAPGALREQEIRDRDVLQQDDRHLHRHHIQPLPKEDSGHYTVCHPPITTLTTPHTR